MIPKKKILFFHFDLQGGGAEKVLINLLRNLNPDKYDITLQTIFGAGPNLKDVPNNVKFKCLFKHVFRGFSIIMKLVSPSLLHKILIREKYDIEVAFLESSPTRIVSACSNKGTKKIAWVHTTYSKEKSIIKSYRNRDEAICAYNKYDMISFVSQETRDAFEKMMPEVQTKTIVIQNVADFNHIYKMAEEKCPLECDKSVINLYSVGRLTKVKGYERLIKCFGRLIQEGINNFHFYLLGKGEEKDTLLELINKLRLDNHVSLLGYDNNPYKYAKQMDLFICSSYVEGYSTAVTETVALGVPVLTTDCSGMSDILKNGKLGMIVPNNDDSLYNGMKQLLSNPSFILSYKERINNLPKLTTESLINKYEKLFDNI